MTHGASNWQCCDSKRGWLDERLQSLSTSVHTKASGISDYFISLCVSLPAEEEVLTLDAADLTLPCVQYCTFVGTLQNALSPLGYRY